MKQFKKQLLFLGILTIISTPILAYFEGDKLGDSLYLLAPTLTTTGSAFSEPVSGAGKLLVSAYSLVTFFVILATAFNLLKRRKDRTE